MWNELRGADSVHMELHLGCSFYLREDTRLVVAIRNTVFMSATRIPFFFHFFFIFGYCSQQVLRGLGALVLFFLAFLLFSGFCVCVSFLSLHHVANCVSPLCEIHHTTKNRGGKLLFLLPPSLLVWVSIPYLALWKLNFEYANK